MDSATNIPADQPLSSDNLDAALPVRPIWLAVFGILLVVLGALAFTSVVMATIVSVYFVAISMVMSGAAEIALGLRSPSRRRKLTWMLIGTIYIVAGLFAFFNPLLAAGVLTLLLGASLVAIGIVRLILSFQMRSDRRWWWMSLSAAVTLMLGVLVLAQWPISSLYMLGVFLSVDLVFAGVCWITIGAAAMSSKAGAAERTS